MQRLFFTLPVFAFAFAAAAQSVGLTPAQREILLHGVYQSCYDNASVDPRYKEASARTKTDVANTYCNCMSTSLSRQFNDDDMNSAAQTHQMSPHMQDLMVRVSQQCRDSAAPGAL